MDTMNYKGYVATVHYSDEDKIFFGRVHGINDLIVFEAENARKLSSEFHKAVEDYLETCAQRGREPDKTFNGVFNVRTGKDLHRKAALLAEKYHITLNEFVRTALSYGIDHESDMAAHIIQEPVSEYKRKQKKSKKP